MATRSRLLRCVITVPALAIGGANATANAQSAYPNRPVKLVSPYPPGALTDLLARFIAERLGAALGQPVVVENKPGAGTLVGADFVAKQPPTAEIVARLAAELANIQATPDFKDQLVKFGMEPYPPQTPEQFAATIAAEQSRWAQAIRDSGAKVD